MHIAGRLRSHTHMEIYLERRWNKWKRWFGRLCSGDEDDGDGDGDDDDDDDE